MFYVQEYLFETLENANFVHAYRRLILCYKLEATKKNAFGLQLRLTFEAYLRKTKNLTNVHCVLLLLDCFYLKNHSKSIKKNV